MGAWHLRIGVFAVLVGLLVAAGAASVGRLDAQGAGTPVPYETEEEARIRAAIEAVLDPDTRRGAIRLPSVHLDGSGDLTVVVALRDEGSVQGIRVAALEDVLAILRAVYDPPVVNRVRTTTVVGTFSITGTRGPRELPMLRVVLSAERASSIDWATVEPEDLGDQVDTFRVYPPFGEIENSGPSAEAATPASGTPTT